MKKCNICEVEMNQPDKIETRDCGGDCLMCMAVVGQDPDCIKELIDAGKEELLNKEALEYYRESEEQR